MIKYIILFCVGIVILPEVVAQGFNAGIFGGVTASQVDGDSYSGPNKLGWTAGVYVNREINYDIYWQLGIKYVTRGVYQGPTLNNYFLFGSNYGYVELPLSVHYLYNEKIQIEAGASPEVLVTVKFWDEDGTINPSTYPENRRFGLSVFGGIHYWFNSSIGAGVRFTYSAIPFRDPQEWNHPRYRGYFHNVISLTGRYRFISD